MSDRSPDDNQEVPKWRNGNMQRSATELNRSVDFDEELRKILQDYGMKGWELVQVLQPRNDALLPFGL